MLRRLTTLFMHPPAAHLAPPVSSSSSYPPPFPPSSSATIPAPEGAAAQRATRGTLPFASHPHFPRRVTFILVATLPRERNSTTLRQGVGEKENVVVIISAGANHRFLNTRPSTVGSTRERSYALRKYPLAAQRERKHSNDDMGLDQYSTMYRRDRCTLII